MWSALGGDGPDEEFYRRTSPPENELPVAVPLDAVLARTGDVAVALLGLQVYSTGLSFTLVARIRPGAADRTDLDGLLWGHHRGRSGLLLGVELADGRRATNLDGPGADELVFTQGAGSGGPTSADQQWWLNPLPPDGPLGFVVRCDPLGIAESRVELDGAAIRRAAEDVVVLWPWEPPAQPDRPVPEPPDVPPDSWFAR